MREQNTSSSSERFDINKESIIIGLKRLVAGEWKYLQTYEEAKIAN